MRYFIRLLQIIPRVVSFISVSIILFFFYELADINFCCSQLSKTLKIMMTKILLNETELKHNRLQK